MSPELPELDQSNRESHAAKSEPAEVPIWSICGSLKALYQQPPTYFIYHIYLLIFISLLDWYFLSIYINGATILKMGRLIKVEPYDPLYLYIMAIPLGFGLLYTCYLGFISATGIIKFILYTPIFLWNIISTLFYTLKAAFTFLGGMIVLVCGMIGAVLFYEIKDFLLYGIRLKVKKFIFWENREAQAELSKRLAKAFVVRGDDEHIQAKHRLDLNTCISPPDQPQSEQEKDGSFFVGQGSKYILHFTYILPEFATSLLKNHYQICTTEPYRNTDINCMSGSYMEGIARWGANGDLTESLRQSGVTARFADQNGLPEVVLPFNTTPGIRVKVFNGRALR